MKITAAVMRAGRAPFAIETLELSEPRADEVLVRMVGSGMCHTDLLARDFPEAFFLGPQVYGHEGSGVVEAVGSAVRDVAPGDHVVLSFNACGRCRACAKGRRPHCFEFMAYNMSGGRPDGSSSLRDAQGQRVGSHYFGQSSFSSHAVVAHGSVVKVDRAFDLARLGPLGCGVQTGAGTILNTLRVEPGASVVIAGAGALGLSAVMAAKVAGAGQIVAIDRHESRLKLATKYGATQVLKVEPAALAGAILDVVKNGADYAFDTTGNTAIVRALYEGLNNIGVLALAGVGTGDATFPFLPMISGRQIRGVIEGDSDTRTFIPELARLNAEDKFPFHELITEFPLAQINAAEAASASGAAIKPVLRF